jgi:hypothetical protein
MSYRTRPVSPASPVEARVDAQSLIRAASLSALEPLERRMLLTVNPVIVYNFDEAGGDTVIDSSADGGVQNGTLTGDPAPSRVSPGQSGSPTALEFAGDGTLSTDDQGHVDTVPLEGILGRSGTVSTWVKTTQVGAVNPWDSPGITGMEDGTGGNDIFWGFIDDQGRIGVQAGDAASARSAQPVNDGEWHHVTLTRDETSGAVRVYLDGKISAAATSGTGAKTLPFDSIGALPNYGPGGAAENRGSRYFAGQLDQLQIFDRALSPQEVAQRYGTAATTAPTTPGPVTVTSSTPFTATLGFANVANEQGYQVLRSATGAAGSFVDVGVVPADSTSFTDTGLSRSTPYFYQVVAFNAAGNSAPATVNFTTPAGGPGSVNAYYYNDQYWKSANNPANQQPGLAIALNPDVTTVVARPNFDWGGGSPDAAIRTDFFSTVFTGKIRVPEDGTYTILGFSDDDSYVWVNGQLVSGDPGGHGIPGNDAAGIAAIDIQNPIELQANTDYDLVVVQSEGGGGAGIILRWITPSDADPTNADDVPASALSSTVTAPAAPTDFVEAGHTSNSVDFTFTDNATSELRYELVRSQDNFATSSVVATAGIQSPQQASTLTFRDSTALPGRTYQYRLRAVNFAGAGTATNTVNVTTDAVVAEPGAQGYYFNDQWWYGGTPRNTNGTGVIVGRTVDATGNVGDVVEDWQGGSPDAAIRTDFFSTLFTGKIRTEAAGDYYILGFSDDDSYVWVNGQLVSADPGGHGIPGNDAGGLAAIDIKNPINLAANTEYNFVAVQSEGGGGAGLILRWITPTSGGAAVDIPAEAYTSNVPSAAGGTATGAPVAPTSLNSSGNDLGDNALILRWADNATNEVRYTVQRSTSPTFASGVTTVDVPINATSFTDSGLTPNTTYYYRVIAGNFYGEGTSTTFNVTTRATDLAPNGAPTNLRGSARAGGATRLVFQDNATNEDTFVIQRKVAGSADPFTEVGTRAGTTFGTTGGTLTFDDTTAVTGTQYTYRVLARNTGGDSAPSNEFTLRAGGQGGSGLRGTLYDNDDFTGTTVTKLMDADEDWGNNAPDPGIGPDNFTTVLQGELQAEFSEPYTFYTASDDGVALRLYDATTGQLLIDYDNIGAARGISAAGTFQDTAGTANLVAGRKYRIEVRHRELTGGAAYRFGWSSPSTPQEVIPTDLLFPAVATDVQPAPTPVAAYDVGDDSVVITFRDVAFSESGYSIERSTSPTSGFTEVATAPATNTQTFNTISASDTTPVTLGTTYYYRVRALGETAAANSPFSQTASVVPAVGGTGVTYNGSATVLPGPDGNPLTASDNVLQLTDNVGNQRGSAYLTNTRNLEAAGQGTDGSAGFSTSFQFTVPEGTAAPADGFAFVIQRNSPVAMGGGGGGLNYAGMPNSLALKFDLWPTADAANPSGRNGTGLYANGTLDDFGTDTGLDFASGHQFRVDLSYNAATDALSQTISDLTDSTVAPFTTTYTSAVGSGSLNLQDVLGSTEAFVGFAGATGGANADQRISNWTFNGQQVPFIGSTDVQPIAHVTQVFVNGPGLTGQTNPNGVAFRNLAGVDNTFGYAVPAGANQTKWLPWNGGVNQVAIRFDTDVNGRIDQGDLAIRGINTASYTVTAFTYDPGTHTAVWTLSGPITNDKVRLFLDDAGLSGLDGEWVNAGAAEAYPSGDGTAGGDFDFRINILRGDATQDGRVNALDLSFVRAKLNKTATNPGTGSTAYSPLADINPDGQINALDLSAVRNRLNTNTPPGEPAGITESLFGTQPIV